MMEKGIKYDSEKPRMDLLDPTLTEGIAKVLTFGAHKYDADNWRGGISFTRLIAAMHRHLAAIQKGEDIDPESGEPHVYHLGCCVQFYGWMMQYRPDMDDRWKFPQEDVGVVNRINSKINDFLARYPGIRL